MDTISAQLQTYLDGLVPPRSGEMQVMEAHADATGFPIVGPASGQLCYLLARLSGARRVFELGSGYGYSTAWFARAVRENGGGEVHHVVWDAGLSEKARQHLGALGYGDDLVHYHVGEAVAALAKASGPFDLIFNDIDKQAYATALPVITEKLRPGGVLIVDNMLWSGEVLDPRAKPTASLQGIRELTRLITQDPAWISSIVPIRDGLLVAYRR